MKRPEIAEDYENFFLHYLSLGAGRPFELIAWERDFISKVFGTYRADGRRQIETAYVEIPKKNGKSEFAAGIATAVFFLDEEPQCEVYLAATTRDQAGNLFRKCRRMIEANPELRDQVEIIPSTKTIIRKDDFTCFIKAISADAGSNDGIEPHCVVFDELHRQKRSDLYSILEGGMDTRRQPLMIMITTAGTRDESPLCHEQHEYAKAVERGGIKAPHYYGVIYDLPEGWDWRKLGEPAKGRKKATGYYVANPALGIYKRPGKLLERIEKSIHLPSAQNDLRRLHGNEWLTSTERWIDIGLWNKSRSPINMADFREEPCFPGMDLSATQDITALVANFMRGDTFCIIPHFWCPEDRVDELEKKTGMPYRFWIDNGFMRTTPGDAVDYRVIRKTLNAWGDLYDIREVGYDPWSAHQLAIRLEEDGFEMAPVRQAANHQHEAIKAVETMLLADRIEHDGNPVMTWMIDGAEVKTNSDGYKKLMKPDRLTSKRRIDGASAMVCSVARAILSPDYSSFLEERDIRVL